MYKKTSEVGQRNVELAIKNKEADNKKKWGE
jgi:hypothetical protein